MKKTKEIGYELTSIMWRNINEMPNIWNKTDIPTKDKIVNETGELAVKLVSEAITKNEIVLPIFGVRKRKLNNYPMWVQLLGLLAIGYMGMDILLMFF